MNAATLFASWGNAAITGLVLGLASTLHCAAMCGVFALHTAGQGGTTQRLGRIVAWSLGRTVTYVGLGLLVARLGRASLGALHGGRQVLIVAAGFALLLWGLRLAFGTAFRLPIIPAVQQLVAAWTAAIGPLRDGKRTPFALGLLNGLLPCGMTGTALLTAAARSDAIGAGALMLGFGLATIPVFLVTATSGDWGRQLVRRPIWRVAFGVAIIVLGLTLAWHGSTTQHPSDLAPAAPCPLCPPTP